LLSTSALSVPPVVTDKVFAADLYNPKSGSEAKVSEGAELVPFVAFKGTWGSLPSDLKTWDAVPLAEIPKTLDADL